MSNISAKILLDSITDGGSRLTTWELTYPRMIHAEIMTHRAFSRNAASSRAIPAAKLRQRTLNDPAIPCHWGANQKGMQATAEVADADAAENWWLEGLHLMASHHAAGEALGLHKQIVNRSIEPWMMITIICSFTDAANFFHLRNHPAAEPNFQLLAQMMWDRYTDNTPNYLAPKLWHMPMVRADDFYGGYTNNECCKISVGRCARVSYLTHDGKRDPEEDIRLHDQLAATANAGDPMHASPFEHVAQAMGDGCRYANYEGWRQYRASFAKEKGPDTSDKCLRCGLWGGLHTKNCSC